MLALAHSLILAAALSAAGVQEAALREAARLDAEGKCDQAEPIYRQALERGSPSASLLNNAGNHYLLCGRPDQARTYFEALVKLVPTHQNANLQLARMAVEAKQGATGLKYLARVQASDPGVLLIRAEAQHLAGQPAAAAATLASVEKRANNDPRVSFTLGLTAARLGLFERAEAAFGAAAALVPGNFEVLFNLGRAAWRARHYDRAVSALEVALKLKPGDAGVLLELGRAHAGRQDYDRAVYVLAQARAREPRNPGVLLALAQAAEDAGFHGDSALAYDEYLALRPTDDQARLARARVCGLTGVRLEEALKELDWYVRAHPADPAGYFQLARFTWESDPDKALANLARALQLDPRFAPAHFARGWLLQRLGRTEEALVHFEGAAQAAPDNVRALDQLGLAYLSLDRPAEAEKTLRKALALGPRDREVLMHLGRALMALDRRAEAQQFLEEFRKIPAPQARDPRREAGMIELATLAAEERSRREIERLRRQAAENPNQAELQLRLAQLLVAEGRREEAEAAFRELGTRNADNRIWEEAGASLLRAEQYELAIEFLRRAAPASPTAQLELAVALALTAGGREALQALDELPEASRGGDYYLLKASLLDQAGMKAEAEQALQAGLRLSVSRPAVTRKAVRLLVAQDRGKEALALVEQARRANPADADLALAHGVLLGLAGRNAEAEQALRQVETRWPEWDRAHLAHGLLLESAGRKTDARRKLETALALDPRYPAARCALERLAAQAAAKPDCACAPRLRELLLPECEARP